MKKTGCFSLTNLLRTGTVVLLAGLIILSCNQDAIFYNISIEPEPKDPIIPGSPTNMTVVHNKIYVGTQQGRDVWFYNGAWGKLLPRPGGSIGGFATDGTDLYVLVFPTGEPMDSSMIRKFNGGGWTDLYYAPAGYLIQNIYNADGKIFAGAQSRANYLSYAILYLDTVTSSFTPIKEGTSLLKGAAEASGEIFLATAGSGVITIDGTNTIVQDPVPGTEGIIMTGIIETGGTIVAVSSTRDANGRIYLYDSTEQLFVAHPGGVNFTGAMSVWKKYDSDTSTWNPALLLLGIRGEGTSTTHGYRELPLKNTGAPASTGIRAPGDDPFSTVKNKPKYTASLGKHPVHAILQTPDQSDGGPLNYAANIATYGSGWQPPIFASTSRDGLWVYSYADDQWNAQD